MEKEINWRYPVTLSFRVSQDKAGEIYQMANKQNLTRSEFLRLNLEKILTPRLGKK